MLDLSRTHRKVGASKSMARCRLDLYRLTKLHKRVKAPLQFKQLAWLCFGKPLEGLRLASLQVPWAPEPVPNRFRTGPESVPNGSRKCSERVPKGTRMGPERVPSSQRKGLRKSAEGARNGCAQAPKGASSPQLLTQPAPTKFTSKYFKCKLALTIVSIDPGPGTTCNAA